MSTLPETSANTPRRIDPAKTFESIASWVAEQSQKERAPGLIVGISGTDSILTFLACAEAFKRLGKQHRVLGLNFDHVTHNEPANGPAGVVCVKSDFNWVSGEIYRWLHQRAPEALLEVDISIPHSDDNIRWGHLFSRAVRDTNPRHGLSGSHYFPVGTRNATEQALGNYSQLSKNVSLMPIVQLYKSEVLELCEYLDVPEIAISKSREVDCDCGRFETQANHMKEVDLFIMYKQGLISKQYVKDHMEPDVYDAVVAFYLEESTRNAFRERTPYKPQDNLVVTHG